MSQGPGAGGSRWWSVYPFTFFRTVDSSSKHWVGRWERDKGGTEGLGAGWLGEMVWMGHEGVCWWGAGVGAWSGRSLCLHPTCSLPVMLCWQLRAAEVEIKDLQSEFELEKIDYLATIRRQERDAMFFQQLLEQVQPLIRRDCNYSNLERIRRESSWDEDNGFWKIPEPVIMRTSLPVGQSTLPPALPSVSCGSAQT